MEIQLSTAGLAKALERLIPEMDHAFEGAMMLSLDVVAQEAAIRAPLVTGELVLSINAAPVTGVFSEGTLVGIVSASAPQALWVGEGTKAHLIQPKKKRALRWAAGGTGGDGWRFAKKVNHPGTKAKPFLKPALQSKREYIEGQFEKATKLAIRRAGLR
jgi:hypothetical protein